MKIYLVGGAVRDKYLLRRVKEKDWVVVGSSAKDLLAQGFKAVGKSFPVFIHPETHEEYALARKEKKMGKGYYGFTCEATAEISLEEDLKRRDLTINAMAEDQAGNLYDPYGGLKDLQTRCLRHVSAAFEEDPLRILRVARFAAELNTFHFSVAPETLQLMRQMLVQEELSALPAERVWQELHKALASDAPSQFFYVLRLCGADKILFPEIAALFGVPAREIHHPEIDSWVHTMLALDMAAQLRASFAVRFAVLLHDLGKGITPLACLPRHPQHGDNGMILVKQFAARLRVPKSYRDLALLVTQYHGDCHRILTATPETLLHFLSHLDAFRRPARFTDFLLACEADSRGRLGYANGVYPQRSFLLGLLEKLVGFSSANCLAQGLKAEALKECLLQEKKQFIQLYLEAQKNVQQHDE